MELLKKLFSSQKFTVLLASAIGLLITKVFKVQVEQSTVLEFVGLIASWLIAQGISDHGKGAAKVEAIANAQVSQGIPAAEKIEAIKSV